MTIERPCDTIASNWVEPVPVNQWIVHCEYSQVVTLRQWFDLLAGIFGKRRCTPFDQMELLLCLKEQGFEL